MMSWTRELDEAAVLVTSKGRWHVLLFYLLCGLAAIPTSFLVFSQVFTNATPQHWCAPPHELGGLQLSEDLLRNLTVPELDGVYESCVGYAVDSRAVFAALRDYVEEKTEILHEDGVLKMIKTHRLVPAEGVEERKRQISHIVDAITLIRSKPTACLNGWRFSSEQYTRTLVTEYSLLMIYLEVPLAIAASFPTSYPAYIGIRMVSGLFFPAMYQLPFILALELMPPAQRTNAGIVVGMLFAAGMSLLALIAYVARDWFHLSLATSLPFVFLYAYYWLIPESPRWLAGRDRTVEAEKVLRAIAKKNGIDLHAGFSFGDSQKPQY
ncbi:unnamed protein product, partial [Iphiclides podalirius]